MLTRDELVDIQFSTRKSVEALRKILSDTRAGVRSKELARDALSAAELNLARIDQVLGRDDARSTRLTDSEIKSLGEQEREAIVARRQHGPLSADGSD